MARRSIGERVTTDDDRRLVSGHGCFVDDVSAPDALHAVFVRSCHARARLVRVDLDGLRGARGFVAAYTHADLGAVGRPLPLGVPHPGLRHPRTQCALADGVTRFAGEPIAMIVATDPALAQDLLARVRIDYEPLPPVVGITEALAAGTLVHPDVPGNLAAQLSFAAGDAEAAFERASHVLSRRLRIERGAAMPLETRGVLALPDSAAGRLTVYDSTQNPTMVRTWIAGVLGLRDDQVDVVASDVGGGFGVKGSCWYPEELLVPLAAMRLGRSVKWIEQRGEHFGASNRAGCQVHDVRIAFDDEGRLLALEDRFVHDAGAYVPLGVTVPVATQSVMLGPYRVPAYRSECRVVYTNTPPVTPYRGAGQPEACFVIERMIDALAGERGLDRVEVRRRNLADASGPAVLREALRLAEAPRQSPSARKLGFGVALYRELTGAELYEGARVHVQPGGRVSVATGIGSQGQGQRTTLAQLAADTLGVPVDDVVTTVGDTRQFRWGAGTFGSRSAVLAGNAVVEAATVVREKALGLAAAMLGAAREDLVLEDARISVRGAGERGIALGELAHLANPAMVVYSETALAAIRLASGPPQPLPRGAAPGLEATSYFAATEPSWACGCHAVVVEVDPETFAVELVRYAAVHDCGRAINPAIVEGQIRGAVAQGIGGTLFERLEFDDEGRIRNASLRDYLLPGPPEIPAIQVGLVETPSPTNPLGVRGAGEAGIIPVAAALVSAVEDALGVELSETPLTPQRLFDRFADDREKRTNRSLDGVGSAAPAP